MSKVVKINADSTAIEKDDLENPCANVLDEAQAKIEAKIESLEEQLRLEKSKYTYLYSDFENFKKRGIKERSDLAKFAVESFAGELLEVMDNLERALQQTSPKTDPSLTAGLKMVLNQFKSALEKKGIRQIESVQKQFDPDRHEAIAAESSEHPPGTVLVEHTKGYMIHDRLLRPARVTVSKGTEFKNSL